MVIKENLQRLKHWQKQRKTRRKRSISSCCSFWPWALLPLRTTLKVYKRPKTIQWFRKRHCHCLKRHRIQVMAFLHF